MILNFVAGSIIKHHIVSHLILGIVLRVVLDALRKPVDSKVSIHHFRQHAVMLSSLVLDIVDNLL